MRTLFAVLALMAASTAIAEPSTPRGIVMAYECSHVDANKTGFTCAFKNGELHLHRKVPLDKMSKDRREYSDYEFNRIALRFLQLGGSVYVVTDDAWGKGKQKNCGPVEGKFYSIMCVNYASK